MSIKDRVYAIKLIAFERKLNEVASPLMVDKFMSFARASTLNDDQLKRLFEMSRFNIDSSIADKILPKAVIMREHKIMNGEGLVYSLEFLMAMHEMYSAAKAFEYEDENIEKLFALNEEEERPIFGDRMGALIKLNSYAAIHNDKRILEYVTALNDLGKPALSYEALMDINDCLRLDLDIEAIASCLPKDSAGDIVDIGLGHILQFGYEHHLEIDTINEIFLNLKGKEDISLKDFYIGFITAGGLYGPEIINKIETVMNTPLMLDNKIEILTDFILTSAMPEEILDKFLNHSMFDFNSVKIINDIYEKTKDKTLCDCCLACNEKGKPIFFSSELSQIFTAVIIGMPTDDIMKLMVTDEEGAPVFSAYKMNVAFQLYTVLTSAQYDEITALDADGRPKYSEDDMTTLRNRICAANNKSEEFDVVEKFFASHEKEEMSRDVAEER